MESWIEVEDFQYPSGWVNASPERARWYCERLEANEILFFRQPPFELPESERRFLTTQRQTDSALHKNISYRPAEDVLAGFAGDAVSRKRLHELMRVYSSRVNEFVGKFLAPYRDDLAIDFASFRPLEEAGRKLSLHKRNDLLHVDAFPSRPTRGGRILRVFTNVHPEKPRVWMTADRFAALAERFAADAGLPKIAGNGARAFGQRAIRMLRSLGLPLVPRSAYDRFMLQFHNYLKANNAFQTECSKTRLEFPPMSTWLVYTDGVPHAVLSGQFALEQTYIVPVRALVAPQHAPIRVLEKICGRPLAA